MKNQCENEFVFGTKKVQNVNVQSHVVSYDCSPAELLLATTPSNRQYEPYYYYIQYTYTTTTTTTICDSSTRGLTAEFNNISEQKNIKRTSYHPTTLLKRWIQNLLHARFSTPAQQQNINCFVLIEDTYLTMIYSDFLNWFINIRLNSDRKEVCTALRDLSSNDTSREINKPQFRYLPPCTWIT